MVANGRSNWSLRLGEHLLAETQGLCIVVVVLVCRRLCDDRSCTLILLLARKKGGEGADVRVSTRLGYLAQDDLERQHSEMDEYFESLRPEQPPNPQQPALAPHYHCPV